MSQRVAATAEDAFAIGATMHNLRQHLSGYRFPPFDVAHIARQYSGNPAHHPTLLLVVSVRRILANPGVTLSVQFSQQRQAPPETCLFQAARF